jgi:hypothetical protein
LISPLAGLAALSLGLLLLPKPRSDGRPAKQHHALLELGLRMAAAASLVLSLTGLAQALGPAWSGLLTPFPVASSVMVAAAHLSDGPQGLPKLLRGFLQGMFGFVAFLVVLAFTLQPWGIGWGFGAALTASLAVQGLLVLRTKGGLRAMDPA